MCLTWRPDVAAITPVLDPRWRPKEVVVCGPEGNLAATGVEQLLRRYGVRHTRLVLEDPWDLQGVARCVGHYLDERSGEAFVLNASGGTRAMGLGAHEAFRARGLSVFYLRPDTDGLVWLGPPQMPPLDVEDRLRLDDYLLAHGTEIDSRAEFTRRQVDLHALTEQLVKGIGRYAAVLGVVNWLASASEGQRHSPEIPERLRRAADLWALLELLEAHGILEVRDQRLVFPDEESRFYANGGWLEDHVYNTLRTLRAELGIQDLAKGVMVRRSGRRDGAVLNEIDVAFLANNRLYVIECKTQRFDRDGGPDGAASGALYKLDALADTIGGPYARGMLVSYRDLSAHDKQRSADLGVALCAGRDLSQLHARLRQWVGG